MVLLRYNVTNACNLTSSFVLIKSVSGMRISRDYQPIEVNTDVTTESTRQNAIARTKLPEYGILS